MPSNLITINRAPVLALWATVVAERLGYKRNEALSLAKAVVGMTAASKAKRIGIHRQHAPVKKPVTNAKRGPTNRVELFGWNIPVEKTPKELRALHDGKAIAPEAVNAYVNKAFGDDLDDVRGTMEKLAAAYKPADLAERAFELYAAFRPSVAAGKRGWGQKGTLDLGVIMAMAKRTIA